MAQSEINWWDLVRWSVLLGEECLSGLALVWWSPEGEEVSGAASHSRDATQGHQLTTLRLTQHQEPTLILGLRELVGMDSKILSLWEREREINISSFFVLYKNYASSGRTETTSHHTLGQQGHNPSSYYIPYLLTTRQTGGYTLRGLLICLVGPRTQTWALAVCVCVCVCVRVRWHNTTYPVKACQGDCQGVLLPCLHLSPVSLHAFPSSSCHTLEKKLK